MAQVEAQAQAQAEAQVAAQEEIAAAPKKNKGKAKPVINTQESNQAAAVAAAADQLLVQEKPWAKMTAAEKEVKKAKDAAAKEEKIAKDARENPTVDENGEHIMTVAEAKAQAAELQNTLVAGEAAVEEKIRLEQERMMNEPAVPAEPVKQEEDDGHIETVEEAKAKMEAAQKAMDEGIAATDHKIEQENMDQASMPNFGALADLHGSLSGMSNSRKKKEVNNMCAKLNITPENSDYKLEAQELSDALIGRAKEAGMSEKKINEALAE